MLINVLTLIDLLLTIFFIAHIFSIIWLYSTKLSIQYGEEMNIFGIENFDSEIWYLCYLKSLYFTIVTITTVGYGDYSPKNYIEMIVSIISNVFSGVLMAYSINSIGNIIMEIKNRSKTINETINTIN